MDSDWMLDYNINVETNDDTSLVRLSYEEDIHDWLILHSG